MKISIATIFLVVQPCVSLDTPSPFVRPPSENDKEKERELVRLSGCTVKEAWKTDVEGVLGRTDDPDIADLASMALDLLTQAQALEIPDEIRVSEEEADELRLLSTEFDVMGVLSDLDSLRWQSTRATFFAPVEERLDRLGDVVNEMSTMLERIAGFIEDLLVALYDFQATLEILLLVVSFFNIILYVLTSIILLTALFPLVLLGFERYITQFALLISYVVLAPLSIPLLLIRELTVLLANLLESLLPEDMIEADVFGRTTSGLDCALAHIMGGLPRAVKSMAAAQERLDQIVAAEP